MKFDVAMDFVEFHEGGFVDDPDDSGGKTIYGISHRAHPDPDFWANPTPAKAKRIYKREYWDSNKLNLLPLHLAVIAFDMFVNHNPRDAVKVLQRAAGGLKIDGKMGPKTRARLNRQDVSIPRVIQHRMALYDRIVKTRPKDEKFLDGWRWRSSCLSLYSMGVLAGISIDPSGRLRNTV